MGSYRIHALDAKEEGEKRRRDMIHTQRLRIGHNVEQTTERSNSKLKKPERQTGGSAGWLSGGGEEGLYHDIVVSVVLHAELDLSLGHGLGELAFGYLLEIILDEEVGGLTQHHTVPEAHPPSRTWPHRTSPMCSCPGGGCGRGET